jgi:hypothetical protein
MVSVGDYVSFLSIVLLILMLVRAYLLECDNMQQYRVSILTCEPMQCSDFVQLAVAS